MSGADREAAREEELRALRARVALLEAAPRSTRTAADNRSDSKDAKYRDLVEQAGIAIAIDDEHGNIRYFNDRLADLFGRSVAELSIRSHADLVHSDDLQRVAAHHRARMAGKPAPSRYEFRGIRRDDSTLWLEVDVAIIRQDGRPVGTRSYLWDVTERRRAEHERQRLEARLRQVQKLESLRVLAGGIAHDFNNTLAVVVGNADVALADLPPESPLRTPVEDIREAAEHAADLTTHMLTYAGGSALTKRRLDLGEIVRDTAHLLRLGVSDHVTVDCELAAELPPIDGDAEAMRRIITNLVANAAEAIGSTPGAVRLRTYLATCDRAALAQTYIDDGLPAGPYVHLAVEDTGCGMDESTRTRMFDPFFSTKFIGRGLGLAAVLGIVREHHGAIVVTSKPNLGSTITVLLPASKSTAPLVAATPGDVGDWRGHGAALLADDDPTVRDVTRRMLEHLGFDVFTAADGEESIDIMEHQIANLAVAVLDVNMPGMNGVEASKRILAMRPGTPVLLMSGYDEQTVQQERGGADAVPFLHKPFRLEALRQKLHGMLTK